MTDPPKTLQECLDVLASAWALSDYKAAREIVEWLWRRQAAVLRGDQEVWE